LKWYSIGAVTFPSSWAAIVAAFVFTLVYLNIQRKKEAADLYSNTFFIFILTWKLTFILFHWKMSIENPLSILYFNGGIKGYWLGLAAAFLYLWFQFKKGRFQGFTLYVELWVLVITSFEVVFYILNKEHIMLSGAQLLAGILFILLIKKKAGEPVWLIQLLVLYISFQGLFYSLKGTLLSTPMLTYIAGMIFIILVNSKGREGAG